MKFLNVFCILVAFADAQDGNLNFSRRKFWLVVLEILGLDRVNRIVSRYESWIERYADDYKKKYRLERAISRTRRFVSTSRSNPFRAAFRSL